MAARLRSGWQHVNEAPSLPVCCSPTRSRWCSSVGCTDRGDIRKGDASRGRPRLRPAADHMGSGCRSRERRLRALAAPVAGPDARRGCLRGGCRLHRSGCGAIARRRMHRGARRRDRERSGGALADQPRATPDAPAPAGPHDGRRRIDRRPSALPWACHSGAPSRRSARRVSPSCWSVWAPDGDFESPSCGSATGRAATDSGIPGPQEDNPLLPSELESPGRSADVRPTHRERAGRSSAAVRIHAKPARPEAGAARALERIPRSAPHGVSSLKCHAIRSLRDEGPTNGILSAYETSLWTARECCC